VYATVFLHFIRRILKFTLKQLLQVSVQSPSSESVLFQLAKVIVVKIRRCGWFCGVAAYVAAYAATYVGAVLM